MHSRLVQPRQEEPDIGLVASSHIVPIVEKSVTDCGLYNT